MGPTRLLRRRLALTTILAAAPFLGYGRQAYASCDPSPAPPTFICSGDAATNITTQTVTANNAQVSTAPGFGVNSAADGVDIRGSGDISFIDENSSAITAVGRGVIVRSNGDSDVPGTLTVTLDSTITAGSDGLYASNFGSGSTEITVNGDVTASGVGIYGRNIGQNLTITTGADSHVTGFSGVAGVNFGNGDLTITTHGEVTATGRVGVYAGSYGGNINVTTEKSVTGGRYGIFAYNDGHGKVTVTSKALVEGSTIGIFAQNYADTDIDITVMGEATGTRQDGVFVRSDGYGRALIKIGAEGVAQGARNGIFARSDYGRAIEITNDGVVRNLSGETDAVAITTVYGVTTINNNNQLIGTVQLGELDDRLNNTGLWNSTNGQSDFGLGDNDTLNNSGRVQVAADPLTSEATVFAALEHMNNSGVVSMVDGDATDRLDVGLGTEYVGQNGKLAVDGLLAPGPTGASDFFRIIGSSSGVTDVVVNLLDPNGSTPNFDGIPVVEVTGETTEGNFRPEGGVLNAGFFAWDIKLDGDIHELITVGLGAGSYEFAAGITGAQDIWHQTTGTLLQRQADLRALLAGTQVTPVADFSEPVEPTPIARVTPGLWFKGVGAYLERDQDEANNVSTDRKQEIYGFMAGFDFGTESAGEAWMFGLFGDYVTSDLDFDQSGSEWNYEGPSVGAYATYVDHAFYADVTVKADFLDVDIDDSDIAPDADDVDTDVLNLGGLIDAGYKMPLNHGLFAEPQASLSVVHTEIDDIGDVMGGSVDFEDETSVRGRLGLRLGHELTASNQLIYSSDVTASVWQEFAGDNDVTVAAPGFPVSDISDSPSETYGDVALGFSVQSPEGWSSFLRANYQFAEDYDAFAGNAGVRYAW